MLREALQNVAFSYLQSGAALSGFTGRPSIEEEFGVIIVIEDGGCKVLSWFGVIMDHGCMQEAIQFVSVSL